eukprot:6324564-Prymnesium_polylepis.1
MADEALNAAEEARAESGVRAAEGAAELERALAQCSVERANAAQARAELEEALRVAAERDARAEVEMAQAAVQQAASRGCAARPPRGAQPLSARDSHARTGVHGGPCPPNRRDARRTRSAEWLVLPGGARQCARL